jgi:outer membrane protein assembly factor BamD (BamD/ComL family)
VVKQYQDAPVVEEALAQMVFGYNALGLDQLRDDARRVLEKNYPSSAYLRKAYDPKVRSAESSITSPSAGSSTWSRLKFWEKSSSVGK